MLLFLPLAHVFARSMQCAAITSRVTIGYCTNRARLANDMTSFKPDFVLGVPVVFDHIRRTTRTQARSRRAEFAFRAAESAAEAWSRAQDIGGPSWGLRLRHAIFDVLIYRMIRASFGGRCIGAISGGGALGPEVGHFFRGVGLPILEGYGLTESSGGATSNLQDATRMGTVGRPMAGITVRIAENNEILLHGDTIFTGYWNNPAATQESLDRGWLHTGDTGELDDDGYLTITGFIKDMLVTTGAENVAYTEIENRVRSHPLIEHCMVLGDRRPYAAALVTLDPHALATWRTEHARHDSCPPDLADDPQLRASVQTAVDDANTVITTAYGIKKFTILPTNFTIKNGELTPEGALNRDTIEEHFSKHIASLYTARS